MSLLEILVLAVGLSMDSFAVSLTSGVVLKPFTFLRGLKIALFMGVFQGAMALLGWWLGVGFKNYIEAFDHWIAFSVLLFLGGKMIYEGCRKAEEDAPAGFDPADTKTLVGLSVATSIDALMIGVSFAFLDVEMLMSSTVIAVVTFLFSWVALYIGKWFGSHLQRGAEIVGGSILVLIGVKVLIEHLFLNA